jgi:uncharacterized membrane protein
MKLKSLPKNFKTYIFRGFLALIPLYLSYPVISFLYVYADKELATYIEYYLGYRIPGLGIILVALLLCLLGLLASNWVDFITGRIRNKETGETMVKLFIPTAPNPATGFTGLVKETEVRLLPWTVQEAMKVIIPVKLSARKSWSAKLSKADKMYY